MPHALQDIASRITLDSATEFLFGQDVQSLSTGLPYLFYSPLSQSSAHRPGFLCCPNVLYIVLYVLTTRRPSTLRFTLRANRNEIHMPKTLKGVQTCFSIALNNRCTNPFAVFIRSPWTLALSSPKMSKHPGSFYGLRERNEVQYSIVLKNSKRRFSVALRNRFTEPFALLFPSSSQCPFSSTQTLKRSGLFCIFRKRNNCYTQNRIFWTQTLFIIPFSNCCAKRFVLWSPTSLDVPLLSPNTPTCSGLFFAPRNETIFSL